MKLHVLGSNGWFPTNEAGTVCLLLESSDYYVVFDAGSGIYKLDEYIKTDKPIYVLLSHFHLDHISGFHVFAKFNFKQGITIFGQPGTKEALQTLISRPYSNPFEDISCKVEVRELPEGKSEVPFEVEAKYLEHADPCFGYRLTIDDKVVTYCTDTGYCDNIVELAKDADLLITECALGVGEEPNPKWPHLNPEIAGKIANEAGAKKLLLTHFSPMSYPKVKDRKEAEIAVEKTFSPVVIAKDNIELDI